MQQRIRSYSKRIQISTQFSVRTTQAICVYIYGLRTNNIATKKETESVDNSIVHIPRPVFLIVIISPVYISCILRT